jgi:hypothetical protein
MSDVAHLEADYEALNELIVNCADFERLEALLGGFNLFQVLKFEHGEIRHSNVLAWILDPQESHGLGALFLKKWLMRAIHESAGEADVPVSAVDIDGWQLVSVEVRREWRNIDLLLILVFASGRQWVVCIENKILSTQHGNQLQRYRRIVETEFAAAERRLYLFLTKGEEEPEDPAYIKASYTQVHKALRDCLESRSHAIGDEPRVLLNNYLRLLEEKFMDESEIARTALRIYQQHRRALDVIFEHRPDNLRMASEKIKALIAEHAEEMGIQIEPSTKAFIRFIPKSWNHPGNTHGSGWAGSSRTVLFELNLSGKRPYLYMISGKAPEAWIEALWQRAGTDPFRRPKRNTRPQTWCTLHSPGQSKIVLEDDSFDPSDIAQKVFDWAREAYLHADTQQAIQIVADSLPRLESAFAQQSA